jgi:hypothetical protein
MSKTSAKYGEELYRSIQESREALKQILLEYRTTARAKVDQENSKSNGNGHATTLRLQRSLERAVAKYSRLCKAFDQYQDRAAKKKTPA